MAIFWHKVQYCMSTVLASLCDSADSKECLLWIPLVTYRCFLTTSWGERSCHWLCSAPILSWAASGREKWGTWRYGASFLCVIWGLEVKVGGLFENWGSKSEPIDNAERETTKGKTWREEKGFWPQPLRISLPCYQPRFRAYIETASKNLTYIRCPRWCLGMSLRSQSEMRFN